MIALLGAAFPLSISKSQALLQQVLGVELSRASIVRSLQRVSAALEQPITAAQAYYISVGQNPRGASVDTPWNYVEQWGWLLDKTWFNKNVRRMPNQAPAGKGRQSEMTADDETAIAAAKAAYSQQNPKPRQDETHSSAPHWQRTCSSRRGDKRLLH